MASVLFAPFASHQLNMAAVTAAIATSGESHPDKNRRYIAGMSCGVFYILGGLLATFIVSLFSAIPAGMITALAGSPSSVPRRLRSTTPCTRAHIRRACSKPLSSPWL